MEETQKPKNLVAGLENCLAQLNALWQEAQQHRDLDLYTNRKKRWKIRWKSFIEDNISAEDARNFGNCDPVQMMIGGMGRQNPWVNPQKHYNKFTAFLKSLIDDITEHPEDFKLEAPGQVAVPQQEIPTNTLDREVFIVHGHDGAALAELKDLLRDEFKIPAKILFQQAGQGRTIVEKFEQEAASSAYAIVLMTPDDQVTAGDKSHYQSRPNVIFELGWFYGKLGRQNVCILSKQGTDIHSDISGVNRIEFRNSVDEAFLKIKKELESSGLL
jgi:predicted nucleotide-binding protein